MSRVCSRTVCSVCLKAAQTWSSICCWRGSSTQEWLQHCSGFLKTFRTYRTHTLDIFCSIVFQGFSMPVSFHTHVCADNVVWAIFLLSLIHTFTFLSQHFIILFLLFKGIIVLKLSLFQSHHHSHCMSLSYFYFSTAFFNIVLSLSQLVHTPTHCIHYSGLTF